MVNCHEKTEVCSWNDLVNGLSELAIGIAVGLGAPLGLGGPVETEKRKPFQAVPVISWAMPDRLEWSVPWYSKPSGVMRTRCSTSL
jgi:hypothetical protein